ncbi:hypothetical protein EGW08_000116 [Elysia chlorotica]|uniref:Endonuclease/exonuclease/phosphatase domain-containing protein n=1 Tax=Elysia chlorotica TaxID=188477 RepID=A0A3S1CGN2_ELYCH|nr:hypothetical protein EGW08_000116 [Elysia chlorotica]
MTQASESLREASLPTVLLTTKTKTRIGTWNIRTLYETGRIAQVSKEMKEYSLKILGLCETRWTGADRRTLQKEEEKEEFYEQLQATFNRAPRRDMKIVMGDINAKVGMENAGKELIMGKQGVGTRNENGELFVEFCSFNDLAIGQKHILPGRKWRRSLQDVRAKRGADAVLKLKLKAYRDQADRPAHRFNVQYLKNKAKAEEYKAELKNKFEALSELNEETVENHWQEIKKTWNSACQQVLGQKTRELKEWISADSWNLIKERKEAKQKINHTQDQVRKEELQGQYRELNQKVKRSTKQDKKNFIHELSDSR